MSRSPYLTVEEAAEFYGRPVSWVYEQARLRRIPHRKLPYTRPLFFLPSDLEAHMNGAALEVTELPDGGRVVKPL